MQKIIKYILPIAFLMLLVLPLANSKFEFFKSERKDENRSFSDSLSFDVKRLDRFPKLAEAYMNDNFSFRTPLLDLFHHIKFYHFNISPHPTKTVVGNDGWFFMAKDEKEIYEGDHNFSENELDDFLSEWQRRRKYLDSSGIKSYWVIAPFKHYVYQEKLPFNIVKSKKRRVDQLKDHFKNDLSDLIIDPLPVFLKHKSENRLFAKMDNHWNYQAGYLTTKILLDKLRKDFPNSNIEDVPLFTWKNDVINSGYHHQVIGVAELEEIKQTPIFNNPNSEILPKYGFPPVEGFGYLSEYEKRFANKKSKSGLRILIIRDSFGDHLVPFISEIFDESVFIFDGWRYELNDSIVEIVKPDIVIYLGLETHINNFTKNYE